MCVPCLQGAEIIAFAKLVGRGGGEEGGTCFAKKSGRGYRAPARTRVDVTRFARTRIKVKRSSQDESRGVSNLPEKE